jgi:hypothetical protein
MHIDSETIAKILDEEFESYPLKPQSSVTHNEKRAPAEQQPTVHLLKTPSSREFKLHTVPVAENRHMQKLQSTLPYLEDSGFTPAVVAVLPTCIVLDYIKGDFPEFKSTEFSEHFAPIAAAYHSLNHQKHDSIEYWEQNITPCVEYLRSKKLINKKQVDQLDAFKTQRLPETLSSSLSYADLTSQNFIQREDGKLFLIDIGGFSLDTLTDAALVTRGPSHLLSDPVFKKHYMSVATNAQLFEHRDAVDLIGRVQTTASMHKSLNNLSLRLFRKRRSRKQLIKRMITDLSALLD